MHKIYFIPPSYSIFLSKAFLKYFLRYELRGKLGFTAKSVSARKYKRNTRAKTLLDERENSDTNTIPTELIIEILSRLPVKSIGRCRCVSKLWASTLRLPYFTELFITRSSARPHLLFINREKGKLLFLSSPQPQNSSPVAVKHISRIPFGGYQYHCEISGPRLGLSHR